MSKKNGLQKKRILSTPYGWYIAGGCFLLFSLLIWIFVGFYANGNESALICSDVFKNIFFAVLGSFFVAILIDLGNTSRDNKHMDKALTFLRPALLNVYDIISLAAFIFKECFNVDNNGKVLISNFYNGEFCYKTNKVVSFKTFQTLTDFEKQYKSQIERLKECSYYEDLSTDIKHLLDDLVIKGFPLLSRLSIFDVNNFRMTGIRSEIDRLNINNEKLGLLLNEKREYKLLSEEESNKYFEQRQIFRNSVEFQQILNSHKKINKVFKGNKQIL